MTAKASIKDIAKQAGVSIATVSRTLSNPDIVSERTRTKVMKAVQQCDYHPNKMGSNLRTKRTGNLVAIIPDITNPFNANLIKAIETTAQQHGYSVLLGDTQNDQQRIDFYASMVDTRQVDGIILFSASLPNALRNKLDSAQFPPLVNSCEDCQIDSIHKVMINNHSAAVIAVEHLIALGHQHIACITGPVTTPSSVARLAGFKQALTTANIQINAGFIRLGNYELQSGLLAAEQLLALPQPPSAIFCFNDEMAIGAMSSIKAHGLTIPEQISVIGFDDIRFAPYTSPALTTIRQPVELIGQHCTEMLISIINQHPVKPAYIELPVELIIRASTAIAPLDVKK